MKNNFHSVIAGGVLFCFSLSSFSQGSTLRINDPPTPQHLGPSCQFSVSNYCYGDTTFFINQTIRMMNPSWEITDSSGAVIFSSIDTNIKFLFPSMETYYVKLRADNGHPDSITKAMVIDTITKVDFDFQQCSQRFVNMSSCATAFYWDFGDGNFSTTPLPVHLYADTGSYTVTLIAFNGTVSDTLTQSIFVYSEGFPTANFTYFQSNDTVYFFGDTAAEYFNWDFGDQALSNLQNPSHAYTDTGDYNVFLLVTCFCGMASQSQLVHVFPPAGILSQVETNFPLDIYPNPFTEKSTLRIPDFHFITAEIKIVDVFGREIFVETINNSESFIIHRGNLPSGIYFIRLLSDEKNTHNSKLIIQ